jgi:hypothetical protein
VHEAWSEAFHVSQMCVCAYVAAFVACIPKLDVVRVDIITLHGVETCTRCVAGAGTLLVVLLHQLFPKIPPAFKWLNAVLHSITVASTYTTVVTRADLPRCAACMCMSLLHICNQSVLSMERARHWDPQSAIGQQEAAKSATKAINVGDCCVWHACRPARDASG